MGTVLTIALAVAGLASSTWRAADIKTGRDLLAACTAEDTRACDAVIAREIRRAAHLPGEPSPIPARGHDAGPWLRTIVIERLGRVDLSASVETIIEYVLDGSDGDCCDESSTTVSPASKTAADIWFVRDLRRACAAKDTAACDEVIGRAWAFSGTACFTSDPINESLRRHVMTSLASFGSHEFAVSAVARILTAGNYPCGWDEP